MPSASGFGNRFPEGVNGMSCRPPDESNRSQRLERPMRDYRAIRDGGIRGRRKCRYPPHTSDGDAPLQRAPPQRRKRAVHAGPHWSLASEWMGTVGMHRQRGGCAHRLNSQVHRINAAYRDPRSWLQVWGFAVSPPAFMLSKFNPPGRHDADAPDRLKPGLQTGGPPRGTIPNYRIPAFVGSLRGGHATWYSPNRLLPSTATRGDSLRIALTSPSF